MVNTTIPTLIPYPTNVTGIGSLFNYAFGIDSNILTVILFSTWLVFFLALRNEELGVRLLISSFVLLIACITIAIISPANAFVVAVGSIVFLLSLLARKLM
jgi:hypothetical protein